MVTNVYIILSWAATATGSGVLKWKLSTCFRNIFFAPGPHHLLLDSEKFSQGKKCSKVHPGHSCDNQGFWLLLPLPCMHGPLAPCSNGATSFTAQHLGIYQAGKFGHGLVMVWFLAKSAPQSVISRWVCCLHPFVWNPLCMRPTIKHSVNIHSYRDGWHIGKAWGECASVQAKGFSKWKRILNRKGKRSIVFASNPLASSCMMAWAPSLAKNVAKLINKLLEDSPVPGIWCHVSALGPWLNHSGDGAPQQLGVERYWPTAKITLRQRK